MRNFAIQSIQTIASIGKILILSKFSGILQSKQITRRKKIIILGNGPSLTRTIEKHAALIAQSDALCVNNFASSPHYQELKPKFYIMAAHIVFQEENTLSEEYITIRNIIFTSIENKTNWEMYLMVPFIAKKSSYFNNFLSKNKNITPLYFNTTPIEGLSSFSHFFFQNGLGMPRPHNVIIPSIMNAIYLGYQEIQIVGADHSWLKEISVNDQNEALVNQKHFYDENESKPMKMQDYITRPRRLHEVIHKFYLSFRGYWDIKHYAEKRKVRIVNCSEESMIDAFERGELN